MLKKLARNCAAQRTQMKYTQQIRHFNAASTGDLPKNLDKNGEPRFLDQVKLFMGRAA